jgi:16S rRNA (adenine1518-N6/adenine1519-N6)-dimethyltransferase
MVQPKKHLGQHFLTDPAIAERIVNLLPPEKNRTLIEVGPGKGVLTEYIFQSEYKNFIAVDVDKESIEYLKDKYKEHNKCFLEGDILKMPLEETGKRNYHIIGNFPYNISSQIFFKVLEEKQKVEHVVCMIQKEVAERIAAPPGSRTYGILSVFLQAYYNVEFQFSVKPGSFYPVPKVTSSVITLTRNNTENLECNEKLFFRVVKTTFNQRRKTIRNSLRTILLTLGDEIEILSKRPEQLGVKEFVELTNWIEKRI